MDWCFILLVASIPLDFILSILFIGFYQPGWSFDFSIIHKYLLFGGPYEFTQSPLDFTIVSAVRICCLLAIIVLHLKKLHKNRAMVYLPLMLLAVAFYSYTLVKLLALSWKPEQLHYLGLWFSVAWSICCSAMQGGFCYLFLVRKTDGYDRIEAETSLEEGQQDEIPPISELTRASTWKHIGNILSYSKIEWKWLCTGLFAMVTASVAGLFIPSITGTILQEILDKRDYDKLMRSVLYVAALTFTSAILGGLGSGAYSYASSRIGRQVRTDLFSSLVRQDIAFFDSKSSGKKYSTFMSNGVMLGALGYMFALSWRLSLVTFITLPLAALATKYFANFYEKVAEEKQDAVSKANKVAQDVISSMRTVRSFANEKQEAKRYIDHLTSTLGISKKTALVTFGYWSTFDIAEGIIEITILLYGGLLVINGLLTTEAMIQFYLYQHQFGGNIHSITHVFTGLMEAVGASRKVFEYMHRVPDMPLDGSEKPPFLQGQIEIKDVHFTYPSRANNPILQGLNLSIPAGKTVALVGPSGGGKSSIVALIEHFYEPQQGNITLDGIPIKDIDHQYYHQKVALVAQEPILYDGSVRQNILYGCEWATEEDMLRAANMANVHDFVMEQEKGYDTSCGEKGVQMSGGQKQRIAIARALVRNPAVLILDEATSALDAESEHLVQEALSRCALERTVLIIAHRLSTIEKADQIAVIQKGRIIQTGSHSELMTNREGLYHSLVARQLLASKTGEPDGT